MHRSTLRYQSTLHNKDAPLKKRIEEIAGVRVRYGYQRITTLLRREKWLVNHKHVYRIYKQVGSDLRSKSPRRSRAALHGEAVPDATGPNEVWTMDCLTDALFDGRRFRILSVLDMFHRECLALHPAQNVTEPASMSRMCSSVSRHCTVSRNASRWTTEASSSAQP